jgi:hypothetical protein
MLRRGLLVPQDHQHLAGAVDDGGRCVEAFRLAFRESCFGDRLGHRQRQVALHHDSLCARRRRRGMTAMLIRTSARVT